MIRVFNVSKEYVNERIDKYLNENMLEYSRSFIQKLAKEGKIKVFDTACKQGYKVQEGDMIFVEIEDPKPLDIEPENIPLDIVYEDDDVILINKPKKMVVHPAAGHATGTLVNALVYHLGDNLSGINGEILYESDLTGIDLNKQPYYVPAKNGFDIKLTIDYEIQLICEAQIAIAMQEYTPKSAKVIVFIGKLIIFTDKVNSFYVLMVENRDFITDYVDSAKVNEL